MKIVGTMWEKAVLERKGWPVAGVAYTRNWAT